MALRLLGIDHGCCYYFQQQQFRMILKDRLLHMNQAQYQAVYITDNI